MPFGNPANSLTIPNGATTGPRIVIGNEVPPELVAWGAPFTVIQSVILYYFNDTDYMFEGVGTFFGVSSSIKGMYNATSGVPYAVERVIDHGANINGRVEVRLGSYELNTVQMTMTTQRALFSVGDGSLLQDEFKAIVDSWHNLTLTGWTNFGGVFPNAAYKITESGNVSQLLSGSVRFRGVCNTNGNVGAGFQIGTMPAGYRPVNTSRNVIYGFNTPAGSIETAALDIASGGAITIVGGALAGATIAAWNFEYAVD